MQICKSHAHLKSSSFPSFACQQISSQIPTQCNPCSNKFNTKIANKVSTYPKKVMGYHSVWLIVPIIYYNIYVFDNNKIN